jgi:hypothetical protein
LGGEWLLVAVAAVWPAGAAVTVAARRPARADAARTFGIAAVAALVATLLAFAAAFVIFSRGGTTAAMASLGPQLVALACLAGAAASGLVATVLWLTGPRSRSPLRQGRTAGGGTAPRSRRRSPPS